MQFRYIISAAVTLAVVLAYVHYPSAAEKKAQIWTDGGVSSSANFNPMQGFSALVKQVKPAVVNIATKIERPGQRIQSRRGPSNDPFDDLFRHFFGDPSFVPPQKRNSLGSGFIISADGHILTNNHVVKDATEITVKLSADSKELVAKVIGTDEKYDLALLKVDAGEVLPFVKFGDSDQLEVGEWVVAIGSPFGLAHTVTAGIVSAKDRVIGAGPYDDFIQTDASINPGNSGGPLFDISGNVVGINTAIHAAGQGIGFAVPVNMAKQFISDVLNYGKVSRGWLGIGIQDLTPALAKSLGLSSPRGVLVSQVNPGEPAEKGGMKQGDIIIRLGNKEIDSVGSLTRTAGMTQPGKTVDVVVIRNGKTMTLKITMGSEEAKSEMASSPTSGASVQVLGLTLGELSKRDLAKLPGGKGVLVQEIDPSSTATDLRPGDVILEVNRAPVSSVSAFKAAVNKIKSGDSVLFLVLRGSNFFYSVVQKP